MKNTSEVKHFDKMPEQGSKIEILRPDEHEELNSFADLLYLELLDLIEQQTACRANIERLSNNGQLLLAKTRYVQGSQSVSAARIPTENSVEFNALCRVEDTPNAGQFSGAEFALQRQKVDKADGYVEPLQWFGALPSTSLRSAKEQFVKCLELVVESANLQREIMAVMTKLDRLKSKNQTQ